ncbi:hypothetical protein HG530_004185 [Fusarium avenaceum]|nr:hypothetical protein HG530_004185 [Fusarium avenaceum]
MLLLQNQCRHSRRRGPSRHASGLLRLAQEHSSLLLVSQTTGTNRNSSQAVSLVAFSHESLICGGLGLVVRTQEGRVNLLPALPVFSSPPWRLLTAGTKIGHFITIDADDLEQHQLHAVLYSHSNSVKIQPTSTENHRVWLHFIDNSSSLLLTINLDEIVHYNLVGSRQTLRDLLQVVDLVWVTNQACHSPGLLQQHDCKEPADLSIASEHENMTIRSHCVGISEQW